MSFVVEKLPATRTIAIDGLDGCTLTVREPSFAERVNQWYECAGDGNQIDFGKLAQYRLCVVVDWSGFVDAAGKPIPFAVDWLVRVIQQSRPVHLAVAKAVREAFDGLEAADEKNSGPPPGECSQAADAAATVAPSTGG